MKCIRLFLGLLFCLMSVVWSRPPLNMPAPAPTRNLLGPRLNKTTVLDTTEGPHQFRMTWIGVGNLAKYTITNVGNSGYFTPPATWDGSYDGSNETGYTAGGTVHTGEYPAGSQQFYVWAAGLWVGAEVPVPTSSGTLYDRRVAACAYYSDQGSMFPLYTSTQVISEDEENGGAFLFLQPGMSSSAYQYQWPFTDYKLNARRAEIEQERGLSGLVLDTGDIVSNQDSYTVYGDYIPESDALTAFSFKYDTEPVGVKIIQRTYSWGYSYNNSYLYLDFYIINMNALPLRNVYFGYFMDTDIGDANTPQGAYDDLIGYDESLNLGYCYDSDLFEPGWQTQSGYIGVTFVETPRNQNGEPLGLTGFQTWENGGEEGTNVEGEGNDLGKYDQLSKGGYELFTTPQDVRMVPCSGPIVDFMPGDTAHLVVAMVVGNSVAELKENTQRAITQYQNAYVGPTAPPMPRYSVTPADGKCYIRWDNFPETVPDPMSAALDFEGYRIYRSKTGIAGQWDEIADFDQANTFTGRVVVPKYSKGNSTCSIGFNNFVTGTEAFFREARYTIEFLTDETIMVYNVSSLQSYGYRRDARSVGAGFCLINPANNQVATDPVYKSGYLIYIDGFTVKISDGMVVKPDDDPTPNRGDVFTIETFEDSPIGDQTGLQYAFIDEGLTNGLTYYYSMTSYDRGDLERGIAALETGIEMNKTTAIPTSLGVDVTDVSVVGLTHDQGNGYGTISIGLLDAAIITGHQYQISFHKLASNTSALPLADFWRLTDMTANTIVCDTNTHKSNQSNPLYDGLTVRVTTPAATAFDSSYWVIGETTYDFNVLTSTTPDPYDYEIRFTADGSYDKRNFKAPFEVWNTTIDTQAVFVFGDKNRNEAFDSSDFIYIIQRFGNQNSAQIIINFSAGATPPVTGDIFRLTTRKPFMIDDLYTFSTTRLFGERDDYDLDNVRVVPNPYYMRADWDRNRFEQKIYFQNLPSECRIRIFNTAGVLIRSLDHNPASATGSESWNLRTEENLNAVNGLYIFQVEDLKSGKKTTGKFAIIR